MLPRPAYVNRSPYTSRRTTYLPSASEPPTLTMRPSCTATTVALGLVTRSISCNGGDAGCPFPAAAAVLGDGAGEDPGVPGAAASPAPADAPPPPGAPLGAGAPVGATALACPVALEGEGGGALESHVTWPLRTGRRPSMRPVSVEITGLG